MGGAKLKRGVSQGKGKHGTNSMRYGKSEQEFQFIVARKMLGARSCFFNRCRYAVDDIKLYTRAVLEPARKLDLHIKLRHGIFVSPIFDLVKVPAYVVALVVWPVALLAFLRVESEYVDVGETHEVHAQDFDAVIYMSFVSYGLASIKIRCRLTKVCPDIFRLVVGVAPPELGVVVWVC